MPWQDTPDAGFSPVRPWLPVWPVHLARAAECQTEDPGSIWSHYRALLTWQRTLPALGRGAMQLLPAHDQVLAFTRGQGEDTLLFVFNLSSERVGYVVPDTLRGDALPLPGFESVIDNGVCVLAPLSVCLLRARQA